MMIATFVLCFSLCCVHLGDGESTVNVAIASRRPVQRIDDLFVGFCIDAGEFRKRLPFTSPKLRLLSSALAPAYIRIGGTSGDHVTFHEGARHHGYQRGHEFTINGAQWDGLNNYIQATGLKLIFAFNILYRKNGTWDPSNAEQLLRYSEGKGYSISGFELGNEQNKQNLTGTQQGLDVRRMYQILQNTTYRNSLILGPDSTGYKSAFIHDFMRSSGPNVVDVITFHHYYMDGKTATYADFFKVWRLGYLERLVKYAVAGVRNIHPQKPVWFGETSSAWSGGVKNISNTYTAGFMWLDKLGVSARYGMKGVLRQELFGAFYSLLNIHTMEPYPDYWLTLLYKRLVGNNIFAVTSSSQYVRAYAHCTKEHNSYNYKPGSVTVYVLNLADTPAQINLSNVNDHIDGFILSPFGGDMLSRDVTLNGHHLTVVNNTLPQLDPVKLSGHVTMPAKNFGFFVLTSANVHACKVNHHAIIGK